MQEERGLLGSQQKSMWRVSVSEQKGHIVNGPQRQQYQLCFNLKVAG